VQGNRVKLVKNLAQTRQSMYRQAEISITTSNGFTLPVEWKLAEDNRWVIMSKLIPWNEFEAEYAKNFSAEGMGAPAKPFRMTWDY
jgi:transposase, IS5 family